APPTIRRVVLHREVVLVGPPNQHQSLLDLPSDFRSVLAVPITGIRSEVHEELPQIGRVIEVLVQHVNVVTHAFFPICRAVPSSIGCPSPSVGTGPVSRNASSA